VYRSVRPRLSARSPPVVSSERLLAAPHAPTRPPTARLPNDTRQNIAQRRSSAHRCRKWSARISETTRPIFAELLCTLANASLETRVASMPKRRSRARSWSREQTSGRVTKARISVSTGLETNTSVFVLRTWSSSWSRRCGLAQHGRGGSVLF